MAGPYSITPEAVSYTHLDVYKRQVWGMLPKNKLSRQLIKKLKVYSGPEHPHSAQKPQPYQIIQIAQ